MYNVFFMFLTLQELESVFLFFSATVFLETAIPKQNPNRDMENLLVKCHKIIILFEELPGARGKIIGKYLLTS